MMGLIVMVVFGFVIVRTLWQMLRLPMRLGLLALLMFAVFDALSARGRAVATAAPASGQMPRQVRVGPAAPARE
jgi:hypothetical protein